MSGGGGTQTSTTTSAQNLPGWEQEPAKAYLSSLMGYVFPGSTVPSSWFNNKGFTFPTGGTTGSGGTADTSAAAQMLNQIDPTGTAYSLFAPMISGSPYLQNMAAQNPAAVVGATSPMAASQLGNQNLYGSSNSALSWIPGYTSGLGTTSST